MSLGNWYLFLIMLMVGLLLLFCLCGALFGFRLNYSNGKGAGVIAKVSVKGILCKTGEVEVLLGSGEQTALREVWQVSVPSKDKELLVKMQALLGHRVRIIYKKWIYAPMWCGDSNYQVVGVQVVGVESLEEKDLQVP